MKITFTKNEVNTIKTVATKIAAVTNTGITITEVKPIKRLMYQVTIEDGNTTIDFNESFVVDMINVAGEIGVQFGMFAMNMMNYFKSERIVSLFKKWNGSDIKFVKGPIKHVEGLNWTCNTTTGDVIEITYSMETEKVTFKRASDQVIIKETKWSLTDSKGNKESPDSDSVFKLLGHMNYFA